MVDELTGRIDYDGATEGVHWHLNDHLGSVRDVVDADGVLEESVTYDPYGNVTARLDTNGEPIAEMVCGFLGRNTWTGRESDSWTGLSYNRARYLNIESGTWLSRDLPLYLYKDSNLYRYVLGMPLSKLDPSGYQAAGDKAEPQLFKHQYSKRTIQAFGGKLVIYCYRMSEKEQTNTLSDIKEIFEDLVTLNASVSLIHRLWGKKLVGNQALLKRSTDSWFTGTAVGSRALVKSDYETIAETLYRTMRRLRGQDEILIMHHDRKINDLAVAYLRFWPLTSRWISLSTELLGRDQDRRTRTVFHELTHIAQHTDDYAYWDPAIASYWNSIATGWAATKLSTSQCLDNADTYAYWYVDVR